MNRPRRHWLSAFALLLLAPVCAEYLAAYDDSTGHPWQLIGNLVLFVPLYGCAALLIREMARRARVGWVGLVLLAAAFGVIQAGVVDQSLFSPDYRGLDGWEATYRGTLIAPVGLSAVNLLSFVGGHVLASICGPIALVEGLRPGRDQEAWLPRSSTVVVALLWLGASYLVLRWHLQTETWHAGVGQVAGALVVGAVLVALAFGPGRRRRTPVDRPAPSLPVVAGVMLALATIHGLAPESWFGVAVSLGTLAAAAVALSRWSRRSGWSPTHVAVCAAAPLLVTAALAFTYDPLVGSVSATAKYAHNAVMLVIVLGLTVGVLLTSAVRAGTYGGGNGDSVGRTAGSRR